MTQIRQTLNRNSKAVAIGLGAAILLLLGILYWSFKHDGENYGTGKPSTQAYYIDEETNKESIEPATAVPPLPGASGKFTKVRAIYYTADNGKTRTLAYLDRYTAKAKKLKESLSSEEQGENWEIEAGHEIRSPAPGSKWEKFDVRSQDIIAEVTGKDGRKWRLAEP